ncbi:uncharacterized protein O3C94_010866 [Discoglossus pictus]
MMNTDKKRTERILNHALEIIYLLTGEEYTIVKKNSPHSSIHQLTEKGDTAAVSLSMAIWEQSEGHKKKKTDGNHKISSTSPLHGSPGLQYDHAVPVIEEEEDEIDEKDILQVTIQSGLCGGLHDKNRHLSLKEERKFHKEDVETKQDSCGGISNMKPSGISRLEQELNMIVKEEENSVNINEGLQDENLHVISINEDGEYEREEKGIQQVELHKDVALSKDMIEDNTPVYSSEMGDETCLSQSETSKGNSPEQSAIHEEGNFQPTLECRQPEQKLCTFKNSFVNDHTNVAHRAFQRDTANIDSRIVEYEGHQMSHVADKPYVCQDCDKTFSTKTHLIRHHRTHTGEKPHACCHCDKCFTTRSQLIRHQRTHTGEKPHSCLDCGKSFITRSHLVIHQRSHTGEKPYGCSDCEKCFITQAQLVIHQRTHTGEKPYVCSECGKGFSQRPSLVKHRRTHTGERPYICQVCGIGFSASSNLVAHMRTHT